IREISDQLNVITQSLDLNECLSPWKHNQEPCLFYSAIKQDLDPKNPVSLEALLKFFPDEKERCFIPHPSGKLLLCLFATPTLQETLNKIPAQLSSSAEDKPTVRVGR